MSEITHNNQNQPVPNGKKARLGRGLGSLLGGVQESPVNSQGTQLDVPMNTQVASQSRKVDIQIQAKENVQDQPSQRSAGTKESTDVSARVAHQKASELVGESTISETARIWQMAVDKLVPNTQQPRQIFDQSAIKELSASIKENGILQPITARRISSNSFEIIAGERRWRAAQMAGLHEVPVVLKDISEKESLELAIIENIQREDLNPMEEAEAYDRLMQDYSLTQQQCADRLGKERATVANALRLLVLPFEMKLMVRKNELTAGHAKALLTVEGAEKQVELAKLVVQQKLSVRATEKLANNHKRKSANTDVNAAKDLGPSINTRLVESLSAELQKLMATKVAIDYSGGKGKISIAFYSDDELSNLVEKFRSAWRK